MNTRLYIWPLGAILVAAACTPTMAQPYEADRPEKRKMQIILVQKRQREKAGGSVKTDKPRPGITASSNISEEGRKK